MLTVNCESAELVQAESIMGRAWASGSTSSSTRAGFPASVNWLGSPQATVFYETASY